MALNVTTLLFSTLVSAVLMIVALGVCVDMKQAPALRSWMLSLAGQAFGFAFLIAAATVAPRLMASIGVFLMSLSVGMMHITIVRFIHRPLRKSIYIAPALLLGVLHPLIYGDTQLTVGITNLFFGVQGLWAAQDLLRVAGTIRWRWWWGWLPWQTVCWCWPVPTWLRFISMRTRHLRSRIPSTSPVC